MKISSIIHKNEHRLKLEFAFDQGMISKIKKIPECKWSKTMNAWHIPYDVETFRKLKGMYPELENTLFDRISDEVHGISKSEKFDVSHSKPVLIGEANFSQIIIEVSEKSIFIKIPKNETDIQFIRTFKFARWDKSSYKWIIPNFGKNLELLKNYFGNRIDRIDQTSKPLKQTFAPQVLSEPIKDLPLLDKINKQEIANFKLWMEHKRYSESTIKTYIQAITIFLRFIKPKTTTEVKNEDMVRFVHEYLLPKKLSLSYQNQAVNAARLFFKTIQGSKLITEQIERPRREHKLPNVLSKEEVKAILDSYTNIKHKAMISLIYACGLRRSELLNLKPIDVDSNRNLLIIRQSKGKKDRIVPISEKLIELLREYYKANHPKIWLFEGQKDKEQYSETSLQEVLKTAVKKTGIKKPVTLHWLRHSYATHLMESGTDLRYIQELLGHKSSRTTEIYTHVSTKNIQKIKSPFDDL